MATITINISSDDNLKFSSPNYSSGEMLSSARDSASDGGAPNFSSDAADASPSASGQMDIGGPPQWLSEVLEKSTGSTGENLIKESANDGDGGAPNF